MSKQILLRMSVLVLFVLTLLSPYALAQYLVTDLVANQPGAAPTNDPNLVNGWGLSRAAASPWWVSDNVTGKATLYNGGGAIVPLVVTIPPARGLRRAAR